MLEKATPPPFVPRLKNYLLTRIKSADITPAEIARRAGISPALLYRFLNEQRDLSLTTIDKILPVIESEIDKQMDTFLKHHQEMYLKEQALFEATATFQAQEGAIESAILGLKEVMDTLLAIRAATGTEFHEAMGFGSPETPESIDAELRALMESDVVPPDEASRSLGDKFRDLMEFDDDLNETPESEGEVAPEMGGPGDLDLTEPDEPGDPDLNDPTDPEDVE